MPVPTRREIRCGILYMIGAVSLFSLLNALVKWEAVSYPTGEIAFFRCGFSLLPCLPLLLAQGGFALLRTRRLRDHVGSGLMQFVAMLTIFAAFGMMPLADAVAITFASPLFVTLLSIPLLGERVGPHRWAAVTAGFLGVLVMAQSGGLGRGGSSGTVLALASAALSALLTITVRRMTVTEATPALVTYQALITTALSAALLPAAWVMPTALDLLVFAAIGLCSGLGQFWWTEAFRFAPAAVAAPFTYLAMVWSLLLGYVAWGETPTAALLCGAAIVAASGLYILYRETLRRVPAGTAADA